MLWKFWATKVEVPIAHQTGKKTVGTTMSKYSCILGKSFGVWFLFFSFLFNPDEIIFLLNILPEIFKKTNFVCWRNECEIRGWKMVLCHLWAESFQTSVVAFNTRWQHQAVSAETTHRPGAVRALLERGLLGPHQLHFHPLLLGYNILQVPL